jgi:2-dehydropantoate 2-reductase
MKILVVGAGAVGGYFGGRLAEAGRDVTFLVRARQRDSILKEGLRIVSPTHGNVTLHPKVIQAGEIAGPYDVILLSVKAYGLDTAMRDFAPAVGPATMIMPALNGMRHMDSLIAKFGEPPVIGGVCLVSTELDESGRIIQLADFQKLIYGERQGLVTQRIQALDVTLQNAGFATEASTNIMQEMWEKWIRLSSLGAITCLLRGNIGEIEAVPGGADIASKILDECASVATACGYPPGGSMLANAREMMTAKGSKFASSMYRDLNKGNHVEVDQILGDLLERASQRSIAAPLVQAAFVNLKIYEGRLNTN